MFLNVNSHHFQSGRLLGRSHLASRQGGAAKVVVIVLGVLGVVGLLCCGGMALLTYVGYSKAGMVMVEAVKSNPEVVSKIGEIKTATFNVQKTTEAQQNGRQGEVAVDVSGPNGQGTIYIQVDEQTKDLKSARLVMGSGEEFNLIQTETDFQAPPAPSPSEVNP